MISPSGAGFGFTVTPNGVRGLVHPAGPPLSGQRSPAGDCTQGSPSRGRNQDGRIDAEDEAGSVDINKEVRWRVQETLSHPPERLTRASLSVPGEFAVELPMPEYTGLLAGLLLTL
jgi:hypothetical protein